jgi:type IV secretory pathway VirB6-like protein
MMMMMMMTKRRSRRKAGWGSSRGQGFLPLREEMEPRESESESAGSYDTWYGVGGSSIWGAQVIIIILIAIIMIIIMIITITTILLLLMMMIIIIDTSHGPS